MTVKQRISRFLFASAFLLLACQLSGTVAPSATPPLSPNESAVGQTTAQPTLAPNQFYDAERGVSLRIPLSWSRRAGESEENLAVFLSPDETIVSSLYAFGMQSDQTLEQAGMEIRQIVLGEMADVEILVDEAVTLEDGNVAWLTLADATSSGGVQLRVSILTAIYGGREFILLTYGTLEAYDYYNDDIQALVYSLHLELPSLYGIPRDQALVLSGGESTNPRDYDPATTHSGGDKLAFSGLVAFDPQLQLVPDLAESWEISADGTVYTFHLRPNARFHNGRAVTAQDFVYSWERAADPLTQSDTVLTYLGDIVGVEAMYNGEADHIAGLRAVDNSTLEVTIEAPIPYFLMKLTYPTAFVVDRLNVESGEEWYRTPNGTGPYRLTRWDRFEVMIYERNQDFYLGPAAIPYIVIELYSGVGIRLYESGEIDMTGISVFDVDRALDPEGPFHDQVYSGVSLCTTYVIFDVTQPPFDDVKVRQAFSMAFDRQKYIDVLYNGIGIPAEGLYPPALPGYNLDLEGLPYDPERARQLLAQSRYGGPNGLPPIVYTDAGIGNSANADVAAMAQMWEQNLGVTITIENLEPNQYSDLIYSGQHGQLLGYGWCADYPDPENFADVLFRTGAQQNLGNYSNPALDAVLDQARVEQDVDQRMRLYQQAEQILVEDAAALFIVHAVQYVLIKPYVQGFVLTPIDIPIEWYMWLER